MKQQKLLINSVSLLSNRLIQGISTFALTTIIARNLGAEQLGQYVLAIGYYSVFVTFFGLGIRTLFIRELAKEGEKAPIYLVSGTLLQFILSIIAYFSLVIVVFLMPYSVETSNICYILGLSVIPFALSNITEAIFQAQERMYLIAVTTAPIYLLRVGAMIWVVLNCDRAIEYVGAIMVISEVSILILQWLLITRTVKPEWQIDRQFTIDSFNAAKTLFAIDGFGVIAGKLDILLISLLGNEVLIGIYGAIRQMIQPFEIICSSICAAVFPRLSSLVILGKDAQRANIEKFLDLLLCISLPLIPTVFFTYGYDILIFIYKNPEFAQGEAPLKIVGIFVMLFPVIRLFNYLLLANRMEKYNLREVIITTTFGCLMGMFLIPRYQLVGAAWMGVSMSLCSASIAIYAININLFKIRWVKILRRPLLITGLVLFLLFVLHQLHLKMALNLSILVIFYLLVAISILMNQLGKLSMLQKLLAGRS